MNEETIIKKHPDINVNDEKKNNKGGAWKHVTLGGVPGILMGAGLMYANQTAAAPRQNADVANEDSDLSDTTSGQQSAEAGLPIAQMHNELSFGDAYAAARAEVGPGGVFVWHGGIYNTYTESEWNAMTDEQKEDFIHQVNPEVQAHSVSIPTDTHPDVAVESATGTEPPTANEASDVHMVEQQIASNFDMGEDVQIVGYGNAEGHLVVGYDTTGDGEADVAIIDADNNLRPSDDDIIMDREGNMARLGDLNDEQHHEQLASMENPDVAPDMPDYMNDANVDDMNILA